MDVLLYNGKRYTLQQLIDTLHKLAPDWEDKTGKSREMAIYESNIMGALQEVNIRRCEHLEAAGQGWTISDHGNALAGEVGELCNIIKKLRRYETGIAHNWPNMSSEEKLRKDAADEIGDVMTYLAIIASRMGLDLLTCWSSKFNGVSDKMNLPFHLIPLDRGEFVTTQATIPITPE